MRIATVRGCRLRGGLPHVGNCTRPAFAQILSVVRLQSSSSSTSSSSSKDSSLAPGVSPPSPTWDASTTRRPHWSPEWKELGLGAELVNEPFPTRLFFVQLGFGVDQHGDWNTSATKAAVRAVRNAIEFNSIPGVISNLPGGRREMRIHVKLGVPRRSSLLQSNTFHADPTQPDEPLHVDPLEVAKVFPYGKLLPLEIGVGGLAFHTGRVVEELGDTNDVGVCVAACVSIGYNDGLDGDASEAAINPSHVTYSTKDGF